MTVIRSRALAAANLPSAHQLGDAVYVLGNRGVKFLAKVVGVCFSDCKVFYDVQLEISCNIVYNVDSVIVLKK